jgi:CHAT domain-containing protein
LFPIHAAGIHQQNTGSAVLDRVVSSYAVTIQSMVHKSQHRQQSSRKTRQPENVVLVAMAQTPKYHTLHFVSEEVDKLEKLFTAGGLDIHWPQARHDAVLEALADCDIFHFAGHGSCDAKDPANGTLLLQDWTQKPLTVETLITKNLQIRAPLLAFLSACGTGQVKDESTLDESLHLMTACQLAGFQHVIGTLWEVDDACCMDVAYRTYEHMQKHGMSHDSIREGLHHGIRSVRHEWMAFKSLQDGVDLPGVEGRESDTPSIIDKQTFATLGSNTTLEQTSRDAKLCEDEKHGDLNWVPYIHFGP